MSDLIPANIRAFALTAYDKVIDFVSNAPATFKTYEGRVITKLQELLPDQKESVAKVVKAIPETVFAGCMLTGTLKPLSLLYSAARLIWVVTPYIQKLVQGNFGAEARSEATKVALERIEEIQNRFKPALFIACGVTACASTLFGLAALTPIHLARAGFLASISYMGFQAMTAKEPEPQATTTPTPTTAAAVEQAAE